MQPSTSLPPSFPKDLQASLPIFSDLRSRPESQLETATQLLSNFSLFQTPAFKSSALGACLRDLTFYLDYQIHPPKTVFYHEGTTSQAMYFVLQGTVNTYIPKTAQELKVDHIEEAVSINITSVPKSTIQNPPFFDASTSRILEKLQHEVLIKERGSNRPQRERNRSRVSSNDDDNMMRKTTKLLSSNHSTMTDIQIKTLKEAVNKNQKSTNDRKTSLVLNEEMEEVQGVVDLKKILEKSIADGITKLFREFTNRAYKYFLGGNCLFKFSTELQSGGCFGNLEFRESGRSLNHTAIAATETHVLVCQQKDFINCFQNILFERDQKIGLFRACLTSIAKLSEINNFAKKFQKTSHGVNEVLFSEGAEISGLYFIIKGEVELFKQTQDHLGLSPKRSKSFSRLGDSITTVPQKSFIPFPVMKLGPKQFFGEEILTNEPVRKFTAIVTTSVCEAYFLPIECIEEIRERCKNILEFLRRQYVQKLRVRDQRLRSLVVPGIVPEQAIQQQQGNPQVVQYESLRKLEKYLKPQRVPFVFEKIDPSQGLMADELAKGRKTRERIAIAKKSPPIDYLVKLREQKEARSLRRERRPASWDRETTRLENSTSISQVKEPNVSNLKVIHLKKLNKIRQMSMPPEMQDHSTKMDTDAKFIQTKDSFMKSQSDFLNEEFNPKAIKAVFGSTESFTEDDALQFKKSFLTEQSHREEIGSLKRKNSEVIGGIMRRTGSFQGIPRVHSALKSKDNVILEENNVIETRKEQAIGKLALERLRTEPLDESLEVKEVTKPKVTMRSLSYYKQRVDVIKRWAAFKEMSNKAVENGQSLRVIKTERTVGSIKVKADDGQSTERLKPGLQKVKRMFARLNKRLKDGGFVSDIENAPLKIQLVGKDHIVI